jgi:hypothetical protein
MAERLLKKAVAQNACIMLPPLVGTLSDPGGRGKGRTVASAALCEEVRLVLRPMSVRVAWLVVVGTATIIVWATSVVVWTTIVIGVIRIPVISRTIVVRP